jgi:hypothetical protein
MAKRRKTNEGSASFNPWAWARASKISARTFNDALFRESRSNSNAVTKVTAGLAPRLWNNEGQAIVRSVTGVRRDGSRVHLICKCATLGREVRKSRGGKWSFAAKAGAAKPIDDRVAEFKRRVKERSFVAETAFLRVVAALPDALRVNALHVPALLHGAAGVLEEEEGTDYLVENSYPVAAASACCGASGGGIGPSLSLADVDWSAAPPLAPTVFTLLLEDLTRGTATWRRRRGEEAEADDDGTGPPRCVARGGEEDGWTLSNDQARCAVKWLATLHSVPWQRFAALGGAAPLRPHLDRVWGAGSYWNLSKRRHQWNPIATMERWQATWAALDDEDAEGTALDWRGGAQPIDLNALRAEPGVADLAERLLAAAPALDRYLYVDAAARMERLDKFNRTGIRSRRTLIHGDAKSENIFFQCSTTGVAEQCYGCDFQWIGYGLGVIDIVYLLVTSVGDKDSFDDLIRCYHLHLIKMQNEVWSSDTATADFGLPPSDGSGRRSGSGSGVVSLSVLRSEFDIALLDFARFCIVDGVVLADDAWLIREAAQLMNELNLNLEASGGAVVDYDAAIEAHVNGTNRV